MIMEEAASIAIPPINLFYVWHKGVLRIIKRTNPLGDAAVSIPPKSIIMASTRRCAVRDNLV